PRGRVGDGPGVRRLARFGIGCALPDGWEGAIYRRSPDAGEDPRPVVHLANFALPPSRGDFGSCLGDERDGRPAAVAMVPAADDLGCLLVATDGGVFDYGTATFIGSGVERRTSPRLDHRFTAASRARGASGPAGRGDGYWLAAADGAEFGFGAPFLGSATALHLNEAIIAMSSTPTGDGYWLVSADGGVFAFGDASFLGSAANLDLHRPVVAIAAPSGGAGYWLVASDGGVFAFGTAGFHGSRV
ncbi:MAG: hypothetical protein ACRD0D_12050, partial [Acidimicrobiales bacterium]